MSETTLTFEIGGRVELKDLREGMILFDRLISSLTPKTGVAWVVEDMRAGSAAITLRGEADTPAVLERVIAGYETVGRALSQNRDPEHHAPEVVKASRGIASFANCRDYVRFQTPQLNCKVHGYDPERGETPSESVSIGAITGSALALNSRSGLRFILYDDVLDKRVECHFPPGHEETMRDAWGKRVRVYGTITRDWETGVAKTVRNLLDVEILEEPEPGAFRKAKGIIPWKPGDPLPEEVIRLSRDA